jgi:hypothetical protein
VKKAIELLEKALDRISCVGGADRKEQKLAREGERLINEAVDLLITPCRYTPEQWEKRTGEKWPDDWPVWAKSKRKEVGLGGLFWILFREHRMIKDTPGVYVICDDCGGPPPDDWKPEEGKNEKG